MLGIILRDHALVPNHVNIILIVFSFHHCRVFYYSIYISG